MAACPTSPPAAPSRWVRCECAQLAFRELARRMREERRSFEELARETGCGGLCTACIPDLETYLSAL
jgi:bacterioferritin-associated ferredoxin